MPRLVRRQSVRDRILSLLNPFDHALDLYTYIESYDWDGVQSTTSTPLGIALNILLFLARVNCSNGAYQGWEDVLIKSTSGKAYGGGWGSLKNSGYFLRYLSWFLAVISALNAVLCFTKKKKYRMFESNIEIEPSTPNARRVPVNSSPSASQLTTLLSPSKGRHRGYTSATDVWEVSVWDPTPISLRIFSLFSPAHCAIYFLMLPITISSNHLFANSAGGTTTYLTALFIEALLSLQLGWLTSSFTQQMKDRAVVHKEVLREYDSKYVHPRLSILKRDVATQSMDDHFEASVEVYTPQFNRQGFVTHANPNYSEHTKNFPYSDTSGYAATPQIENQLRREQNQHYNTGRLFNRFKQVEKEKEEETPTKSEWASRRGRLASARDIGTPRRPTFISGGINPNNVGMNGLVNMAVENSRSLSPSKMSSPVKSRAKTSSYGASLGMGVFGTPKR
ncbi:hypothetical protein EV426DRAFT_556602 [Tirmania nivea]|nr:hypothetical protein EV426DRAFT_556602 [Tirmania nivea]